MVETSIQIHERLVRRLTTALELARIHGPSWKVQVLEEQLEEEREDFRRGLLS